MGRRHSWDGSCAALAFNACRGFCSPKFCFVQTLSTWDALRQELHGLTGGVQRIFLLRVHGVIPAGKSRERYQALTSIP